MTDNEKRAHDLALKHADLIVKMQFDAQKANEPVDGKIEVKIDYYKEYTKSYFAILDVVNKDFT